MKGEAPYLSEKAKEYIINAMKQEFSPHDSHDPLTRYERKLEAQNAGITRYNVLRTERIGATEQPDDNFLNWIFPDESA